LADRETAALAETPGAGHELVALDVGDAEACQEACRGVETVVHLAADPSPEADFYGSLLENNIKGTYNVFRAAKDQGCRR
jgi:nucleoside-diphosphate-sugar epimerase